MLSLTGLIIYSARSTIMRVHKYQSFRTRIQTITKANQISHLTGTLTLKSQASRKKGATIVVLRRVCNLIILQPAIKAGKK